MLARSHELAFTPDGDMVLGVTNRGFDPLSLWVIGPGMASRHFKPNDPPGALTSLAITPEGTALVGGADTPVSGLLWTWDIRAKKWGPASRVSRYPVVSIQYDHRSQVAALGTLHGTVTLYCLRTKRILREWVAHRPPSGQTDLASVQCLAFSPDGKRLATVSNYDRTLAVWEVGSGRCLHRRIGKDGDITSVAFAGDPNLVLYLGRDARALDLAAGKVVWEGGRCWGEALAVSPDGKTFAVQRVTDRIDLINVKGFARTSSLPIPMGQGRANHLCWSPSGELLACSTSADVFLLWDVGRKKLVGPTGGHLSTVQAVATARNGRLVTAGEDDTFRVWDYETAKLVRSVPMCLPHDMGIAISPDGVLAAGVKCRERRVIQVVAVPSGEVKCELKGHEGHIQSIGFGEGGKTLVSASDDCTVRVWDLQTGRVLWLRKYPRSAKSLGLSLGGKILALYEPARGLSLLRLSDGKELGLIAGTEGNVDPDVRVRFTPDSNTAVFSTGEAVRFVDVQTRKDLLTVRLPKGFAARSLELSDDGRVLAVAGEIELALFETSTGQLIARWGDKGVRAACFAAGDRELVAGSQTSVLAWNLSSACYLGEARDQTPDRATRHPKTLLSCWDDLGALNARKAYQAVWQLVREQRKTVELLRTRLRPADLPNQSRIERLVSDLGDADYQTRARAEEALATIGEFAELALRRTVASSDPETRRRANRLLGQLNTPITNVKVLRDIRSVQVLELIGSEGARQLLTQLAGGAGEAILTREATSALSRLKKRANE